MTRAFVDLHCHTSASFDCLARPESVVRAAASRGITHLAITDHDTIDGALMARDAAPEGLTVIVGEEVKTSDGDLIALFLERAVAPGRPAAETIAEVREQGGLVGIPHPFDKYRGSHAQGSGPGGHGPARGLDRGPQRARGGRNRQRAGGGLRAGAGAPRRRRVGRAQRARGRCRLHRARRGSVDARGPAGRPRRPALPALELVRGRATYFVRLWTPVAKGIQRIRGNGRRPSEADDPQDPAGSAG